MSPTRWFVFRLGLAGLSAAVAVLVTVKLGFVLDNLPIRSPYARVYVVLVTYWLLAILVATGFCAACRLRRALLWSTLKVTALVALVPIFAYFLHEPPLTRSAQKQTMSEMLTISNALEAYRRSMGAYPRLSSVAELSRLLEKQLPLTDGWRSPFALRSEPGGYSLTSYGADGQPDPTPTTGPTVDFNRDIVLVNGTFVTWPEGMAH